MARVGKKALYIRRVTVIYILQNVGYTIRKPAAVLQSLPFSLQGVRLIWLQVQGFEFAQLKFQKIYARRSICVGGLEIAQLDGERLPFTVGELSRPA